MLDDIGAGDAAQLDTRWPGVTRMQLDPAGVIDRVICGPYDTFPGELTGNGTGGCRRF
jgi:hypothetical protein